MYTKGIHKAVLMLFSLLLSLGSTQAVLAAEPAPATPPAVFEQHLMRTMMDHHLMAVEMAELCPDRAVHAELVELCSTIQTTQTAEIAEMRSWMQEWYGISYEPQLTPHAIEGVEHMAALSGEEFEQRFLMEMAPHHMIGIEKAAECLVQAYHDELIQLCEVGTITEAEEIVTMRGWLADWYGVRAVNLMRSAMIGPARTQ